MEMGLALLIVAGAIYLFATERFPIDLVAILVLGTVLLLCLLARPLGWIDPQRWVTPSEGISGFSNPAVITVGAMFVLSVGLQRTGAIRVFGRILVRAGRYPVVLLILTMATMSVVSAFMNNTAAVAVFLPVVLTVCARNRISPSKLLIPLSFASQFGGVCTLIGTSTNLVVSSISQEAGFGPFTLFEMGRLGVILVAAGIVYFLVVGQFLLPNRRGQELTETYQLGEYLTELRVLERSPLIGRTVWESKFGQPYEATVVEILRGQQKLFNPLHVPIGEGDLLLVRGKIQDLMDLKASYRLEMEPQFKLRDQALQTESLSLVEVVIAPRASVVGKTLSDLAFRQRYHAVVLAIQRRGQTIRDKLKSVPLEFGDALLLLGPKEELAKLRSEDDFIVLETVEEPSLRRRKAPLAVGIFALVVGLAAFNVLPIVVSAILGSVALVVTRCISLDEAYRAIDWRVIFLLAGVLPLGLVLEKSGAARLLAENAVALVGGLGPLAVLVTLYLLTTVMTEFISNNASAVMLAPIAISMAGHLAVSPKPFLMVVAFAASTAFATPVGYQTNAMVYNPGGYRFTDYMKVGIPLILIFCAVSVYFIPIFWPFHP